MHEKTSATQSIGFATEQKTQKVAILKQVKNDAIIQELFTIQDPSDSDNVKPLYMQDRRIDRNEVLIATGLGGQEVLVRPLEIKLTKARDVDSVFAFQAETLLPYPLDKAVIERIYVSAGDQSTLLSIIAARKDHVQAHLSKWKQFQIEPEIVSCLPLALAAFAQRCISAQDALFIVHLGLDETTCVIVDDGKLLAAHAFPLSLQSLINALSKQNEISIEEASLEIEKINFLELTESSSTIVFGIWQQLRQNVLKAFYALSKHTKGVDVSEVLMTGIGSTVSNLAGALCQYLNKPLLLPKNPAWNQPTAQLQEYAGAIGLALSGLPEYKHQINFRQQELIYPNPWKRYKKPIFLYMTLCALTAASLFLFGKAWLGYQEDKIKEEYSQVLNIMNKSFGNVEADLARKYPGTQISEAPDSVVLKNFTLSDLSFRLEFLEKELQSAPDTFPLQPNVPKVSDVLAWLSTHANVASKSLEGDIWQPLLLIENFSYSLVKRPELTKKQEKYQVKVEIEFSAPTPMIAREFHDALIAPNDLVDPKSEIKWSANRGKYRTSFYLRDKTSYPSAAMGG